MSTCEKILFCNCGYSDIIDKDTKSQILNSLASAEVQLEVVQDLCELAAKKNPRLKHWAIDESIKIVACYRRTVKCLFNAADAPLNESKVEFLNMRTSNAEQIISSLLTDNTPLKDKQEIQLEEKGQWIPWFPVIDYDRCTNCMQCLNFCLFGVYELSDKGQVQVINPAGCKTNCPACARVCPNKAIIFPKYTDSPINGDEISDDKAQTQNPNIDMSKLDQSDIFEMIKQRGKGKKRFAEDKTDHQQANIAMLQKQLDIPQDVLVSLSPQELGRLKKESERKHHE